ncbi:hypothetical protein SK128_027460 [Halocaridina rubra]|uniref:C2H2-type domain-containing protein n=1 Tax=Halocaridina rubra TaxID=373956 RepID=A0AAN9AC60_HALRR
MYVGEVNVLQTDLSGLIKAAECLRIKGLAVPDEPPNERETCSDNKRNIGRSIDEPDTKRFRSEIPQTSSKFSHGGVEKSDREHYKSQIGYIEPPGIREHFPVASSPCRSPISKSSDPHISNSGTREASPEIAREPVKESPASAADAQSKASSHLNSNTSDSSEREVLLDENIVKDEPHDDYSETEETKDSIRSLDSDPGGSFPLPPSDPSSGSIAGESETAGFLRTSQPQTMEDIVAQALPGTSGLQGNSWEGDRNLLGMSFESYSGSHGRGPQMGSKVSVDTQGVPMKANPNVCHQCGYVARDKTNLRKHFYTHTGEKPYACMFCFYKTTQNSNLRTHIRRHHPQCILPDSFSST